MAGLRIVLGIVAFTVLASAAVLHVFWAFGGRLAWLAGAPEVNGHALFQASRSATLAVAAALMAACVLLVHRILGTPPLPLSGRMSAGASWFLAVAFTARAVGDFRVLGFFKVVQGTRFAAMDSWLYSPACLLLGMAFAVAAM